MKAQSRVYIELQNLYKDKARKDAEEVLNIVRGMAGGEDIDAEVVQLFCTNARFITLVNGIRNDPQSLDQVIG